MTHQNPTDDAIYKLLVDAKTVAVVGASNTAGRPSYGIVQQLMRLGYDVIPVNPNEATVLGRKTVASLAELKQPVDIVDVFRRSEYTPEIAGQAVAIGAKVLWLQEGVANEQAADIARAGGLVVVMDTCIGVMHSILRVPRKVTP
jgi:uncharacterized protein